MTAPNAAAYKRKKSGYIEHQLHHDSDNKKVSLFPRTMTPPTGQTALTTTPETTIWNMYEHEQNPCRKAPYVEIRDTISRSNTPESCLLPHTDQFRWRRRWMGGEGIEDKMTMEKTQEQFFSRTRLPSRAILACLHGWQGLVRTYNEFAFFPLEISGGTPSLWLTIFWCSTTLSSRIKRPKLGQTHLPRPPVPQMLTIQCTQQNYQYQSIRTGGSAALHVSIQCGFYDWLTPLRLWCSFVLALLSLVSPRWILLAHCHTGKPTPERRLPMQQH